MDSVSADIDKEVNARWEAGGLSKKMIFMTILLKWHSPKCKGKKRKSYGLKIYTYCHESPLVSENGSSGNYKQI